MTKLFYFLRLIWFTLFPRKAGLKGWKPAASQHLLQIAGLPPAPASFGVKRLKWGALGNIYYGDCVFAAICHAIMAVGAFLGTPVTFVNTTVIADYLKYDNGQDDGVDIDALLETIQSSGVDPFGKTGPFIKLDPTNVDQLKSAIATFGWVVVGSNLQQAQETQFSKGQIWKYVPGSKVVGGHGVPLLGYTGVGPFIVSWAKGFRAEWDWVTKTCDEAYTGILPPVLENGKFVLPVAQLQALCTAQPAA